MTPRTVLISAVAALVAAFTAVPARAADLGLDYSFGWQAYHYALDSSQEALGIFPFEESSCTVDGCIMSRGYLVSGRLLEAGETRYKPAILVLGKDGDPDTGVGVNGWIVHPALLNQLNDVTYDPATRRMYFVGTRLLAGMSVFTVVCVDVREGNACTGMGLYGSGVVQRQYASTDYSSTGERIVFDPDLGLIVTGNAWKTSGSSDGEWLGVARLDADTGDFINAFSDDGSRLYSSQPRFAYGNTIRPHAIALSPTPAADGKRHLYVGGEYRANPDVHDSLRGFVTAINPVNGNGIGNFGGDNTAWRQLKGNISGQQTAVTALGVLANGKLAILGRDEYTGSDSILRRNPVFARLLADGAPDLAYCSEGGLDYGCTHIQYQSWTVNLHNRGAILERPDNRDLVFFFPTSNTTETNASLWQASANGTTRHGGNHLYVTAPMTAAYPYAAAWDWSGTNRAIFAGAYFNGDTHLREFAVMRVMDDDTIFADTFGGAHSD